MNTWLLEGKCGSLVSFFSGWQVVAPQLEKAKQPAIHSVATRLGRQVPSPPTHVVLPDFSPQGGGLTSVGLQMVSQKWGFGSASHSKIAAPLKKQQHPAGCGQN